MTVSEVVRMIDGLPQGAVVDTPRGRFVHDGATWLGFIGSAECVESEHLVRFGPYGAPLMPHLVSV